MQSILIVEDDKLLGQALRDTFANAGYEAVWVTEGTKALETLKGTSFDLIFLDIMLPGMNGYDILNKVKADPATANIPVVMLTNLGQMNEINKALEIGAQDYVVKANISLQELVTLTKEKYLKA